MSSLAAGLLFLLGLHFALRTVAALYRMIDLWYMIGTAYPRVLRGMLGWGGVALLTAMVLPDRLRAAFLWGYAGFVLFYLSLYLIRHVFIRRRAAALQDR